MWCVMGRTMPRLSHPMLSRHRQLRRDRCSGDVHTSPAWPLALHSCPARTAAVASGMAASCRSSPVGTPHCSAVLSSRNPALLHCYCSAHSSTRICLLLVPPESVGHVSDCYLGTCNALAREVSLCSVWVLKNEQSRLLWSEVPCRSGSTKQEGDVSTGWQGISIFLFFKRVSDLPCP